MVYGCGVTTTDENLQRLQDLVGDWLTFPEVADLLDVPVTRVHRMIEDGRLVDARLGERSIRMIPAGFFVDDAVAPHLEGTITLLHDQGFKAHETIEWLFTPDDSLPGTPIEHLRRGQRGEVRRRAQSLGF